MPQPSFSLTTLLSDILNKSLNNIPVSHGEKKLLVFCSIREGQIRLNPDSLENMPDAKEVFAVILPNIVKQQFIVGEHWLATKQNGACNDFGKIAKPTLIITATDDNVYVPMVNYFVNAKNIYGSWLVQI